jgi:hypothetical protein
MYKGLFFLIAFVLPNCCIFSQQLRIPPPSIPKTPPPQISSQNKYFPSQVIDPATGKVFESNYPDVNGVPFLTEDWKYTLIKLTDGRIFDTIKTRLNLYTKELYFKTDKDVEMFFTGGYVKEMDIYDSSETKKIIYKFETGFPGIDKNTESSFYQVLADGNVQLLKFMEKKISQTKNDMSGEIRKDFVQYDEYYVNNYGIMLKLKKEKEFILDLFEDEKEKISEYLKNKKMNYKNIGMLTELFNYYNSLKQAAF